MVSRVDITGLGRLLGVPNAQLLSARRFRSTAVTITALDSQAPWQWRPQTPDGHELALLANVPSRVELETDDGTVQTASAGFFLHPHHTVTVRAQQRVPVLCAWVPWHALEELDDGDLGCFAVDVPTPLLSGARGFASALLSSNGVSTMYTDYLVEKLLAEMAFGAVLESGAAGVAGAREAAPRDARPTDRARMLMLVRRADPEFGVEELATELCLSTRQLQRAFAAEGTSAADELRRMRIELAQELLRDESFKPLSLKDVATHAGFGTPAALRRAFSAANLNVPSRRTG